MTAAVSPLPATRYPLPVSRLPSPVSRSSLAFSVSRRSRELGIRIALGGRPWSILWLVLRGGLVQLAVGLTIGLALAAAVAPQFGGALFEQPPHDPVVYASIALLVVVAGAIAAIVPARRALAVSPMTALRSE